MEGPPATVRLRLVVSGRVQGVGFRRFVERRALQHDVAGWVRNRADGSVELAVEGTPAAVDHLRAEVRGGPPGSHVVDVSASPLDAGEVLTRPFGIRRG